MVWSELQECFVPWHGDMVLEGPRGTSTAWIARYFKSSWTSASTCYGVCLISTDPPTCLLYLKTNIDIGNFPFPKSKYIDSFRNSMVDFPARWKPWIWKERRPSTYSGVPLGFFGPNIPVVAYKNDKTWAISRWIWGMNVEKFSGCTSWIDSIFLSSG